MTPRLTATLGACFAGLAVAFGAFGTHGLADLVTPERLATFQTAAQYQMYHALALFVVAGLDLRARPERTTAATRWAGRLFVTGILLFSGSLYLLVLTDTPWLGAVAPLGGAALLGGWAATAWAAWQGR